MGAFIMFRQSSFSSGVRRERGCNDRWNQDREDLSSWHPHHAIHEPRAQEKKKKYEPPAPPPRVGKKQRKREGQGLGSKLPNITPNARCKLRLLKLERVKDYLLMEEEWVKNQELLKPHEERNEEERSKVT